MVATPIAVAGRGQIGETAPALRRDVVAEDRADGALRLLAADRDDEPFRERRSRAAARVRHRRELRPSLRGRGVRLEGAEVRVDACEPPRDGVDLARRGGHREMLAGRGAGNRGPAARLQVERERAAREPVRPDAADDVELAADDRGACGAAAPGIGARPRQRSPSKTYAERSLTPGPP